MKSKKKKKRGPGRPPTQKYFNGEELRAQARENIKASTERRLGISNTDVEEFADTVSNITGKHKFTREEMDEIREKVDFFYEQYLVEKHEAEAEFNEPYVHAARIAAVDVGTKPTDKMMTPEAWFKEHDLRPDGSCKRGPKPKRKKAIWDLSPGERGTAETPSEPIDADAIEAKFLELQYERHLEEQKQRQTLPVGKRLRPAIQATRPRADRQDFWI